MVDDKKPSVRRGRKRKQAEDAQVVTKKGSGSRKGKKKVNDVCTVVSRDNCKEAEPDAFLPMSQAGKFIPSFGRKTSRKKSKDPKLAPAAVTVSLSHTIQEGEQCVETTYSEKITKMETNVITTEESAETNIITRTEEKGSSEKEKIKFEEQKHLDNGVHNEGNEEKSKELEPVENNTKQHMPGDAEPNNLVSLSHVSQADITGPFTTEGSVDPFYEATVELEEAKANTREKGTLNPPVIQPQHDTPIIQSPVNEGLLSCGSEMRDSSHGGIPPVPDVSIETSEGLKGPVLGFLTSLKYTAAENPDMAVPDKANDAPEKDDIPIITHAKCEPPKELKPPLHEMPRMNIKHQDFTDSSTQTTDQGSAMVNPPSETTLVDCNDITEINQSYKVKSFSAEDLFIQYRNHDDQVNIKEPEIQAESNNETVVEKTSDETDNGYKDNNAVPLDTGHDSSLNSKCDKQPTEPRSCILVVEEDIEEKKELKTSLTSEHDAEVLFFQHVKKDEESGSVFPNNGKQDVKTFNSNEIACQNVDNIQENCGDSDVDMTSVAASIKEQLNVMLPLSSISQNNPLTFASVISVSPQEPDAMPLVLSAVRTEQDAMSSVSSVLQQKPDSMPSVLPVTPKQPDANPVVLTVVQEEPDAMPLVSSEVQKEPDTTPSALSALPEEPDAINVGSTMTQEEQDAHPTGSLVIQQEPDVMPSVSTDVLKSEYERSDQKNIAQEQQMQEDFGDCISDSQLCEIADSGTYQRDFQGFQFPLVPPPKKADVINPPQRIDEVASRQVKKCISDLSQLNAMLMRGWKEMQRKKAQREQYRQNQRQIRQAKWNQCMNLYY